MVKDLLVVFGDMHIGSSLALCPPKVPLDGGGEYHASELQLFYWECWQRFWQRTASLKKQHKATVIGITGGDEGEGDHHGTQQIWFQDESDQERAIDQALEKALPVVDEWVFVRGTPIHGKAEERARRFRSQGWNVRGDGDLSSWWVYTGEHGGVKIEDAHAPGTKSFVPHTQGPACARHAQYTRTEYQDSGLEPPDIVLRHHVHYWQGPGCSGGTCCFFVPGWQAPTNWVRGRGVKSAAAAAFIPGGLHLLCEDGRYTYDWVLYRPPTGVAWSKK